MIYQFLGLVHNSKSTVVTAWRKGPKRSTVCTGKPEDKKTQTDVGILDFSRAFDTVPHEHLLGKLAHYGIQGRTNSWIRAFLTGCSMRVILDGESSEPTPVLSGVPQGTVLGPPLFLIYINDMPSQVSKGTCIRLFADDCFVYRQIQNVNNQTILQQDLDYLHNWAVRWGMTFIPSKCYIMHITRGRRLDKFYQMCGTILGTVTQAKYLGITISDDLHWHQQTNLVAKKANTTLHMISRNLRYCPHKTRSLAHCTLVRPKLEYCASVWDPYQQQDIDALERINRRAARVVYNKTWRERGMSPTALLKDLGWDPWVTADDNTDCHSCTASPMGSSQCHPPALRNLFVTPEHTHLNTRQLVSPVILLNTPTTQGLYLSGTILVMALWMHPRWTLLNRDSRSPSSRAHSPSHGSDTRMGFCHISYTDTDTDTIVVDARPTGLHHQEAVSQNLQMGQGRLGQNHRWVDCIRRAFLQWGCQLGLQHAVEAHRRSHDECTSSCPPQDVQTACGPTLAYTGPQEMLQEEAQTPQQVEEDQDKGLFMQTDQGSIQEIPARNQPPATEGKVPVYQQDLGRGPQGRLGQATLELYQAPVYRRYRGWLHLSRTVKSTKTLLRGQHPSQTVQIHLYGRRLGSCWHLLVWSKLSAHPWPQHQCRRRKEAT